MRGHGLPAWYRAELVKKWLSFVPSPDNAMEWRVCPNYPFYEISEWCHVRRIAPQHGTRPGKILKPQFNCSGRLVYSLTNTGKAKHVLSHREALFAFIGPPPSIAHESAHKADDKINSHISNLRWATRSENERDKEHNGISNRGVRNGMSKITRKLRPKFAIYVRLKERLK